MPPEGPPPRVMHLRSSCGFYGAEGVIYTLVHAYRGESTVACLADDREPHTELCERLAAEGRSAVNIRTRGAVDPMVLFRFVRACRRYKPQVIHCHDYKSAAIAALVRVRPHRGLVFTVHGDLRSTVGAVALARVGSWALRRFSVVVGVSDSTVEDAKGHGIGDKRIRLIRNAVDTGKYIPGADAAEARSALGLPDEGFIIGVVGRLSEEKGQDVLLDAVNRMKVPWRLVLVGDGPLDAELRNQADRLGFANRVHFLGRRENLERIYASFDVLALPSHREGLPLTVVEAAACGLPVAATDVGDVSKVVLDGRTGFLVPPNDPEAMCVVLDRLAGDEELRHRLGQAGREHAVANFGAGAMAEAYEKVYREALR